MAIQYIGGSSGTTSLTFPAHVADDLLVIWAQVDGSATAPTLPAGWTSLGTVASGTLGVRVGYRIATAPGTASGTWTTATTVIGHVYRGVDIAGPIGASALFPCTSAQTQVYPALTLTDPGNSWVALFGGHRSIDTALQTPPTGSTLRINALDATDHAASFDTAGSVASWSPQSVSIGGASTTARNATASIELIQSAPTTVTGNLSTTDSGADIAAAAGQVLLSAYLSAVDAYADAATVVAGIAATGSLSAVDAYADAADSSGIVRITASLSSTDALADAAAFSGTSVYTAIPTDVAYSSPSRVVTFSSQSRVVAAMTQSSRVVTLLPATRAVSTLTAPTRVEPFSPPSRFTGAA